MTDGAEKKSFWTTLPGMITATAGLITALAGLIAVLVQAGVLGGSGSATSVTTPAGPSWAAQANQICARANDAVDDLPQPNTNNLDADAIKTFVQYGRASARISRRMLRDLAALTPPSDQRADVAEFLRLGAKMNEAADEMWAAFAGGDLIAAQAQEQPLSSAGKRFNAKALDLGATTCAEGASLAGATLPGG
jgi:hypothetical protein